MASANRKKKFAVVDVAEPNLLDNIFDYKLPPRITFAGPWVEEVQGEKVTFDPNEALKRDLVITDTTFRDGQQSRPPYTVEQQVKLYDGLARLGGPNGVIRQTEFFLYTKNDRTALAKCRELGHRCPEITGWVRADPADFKLVKEAQLTECGMLTSSSDYHIFYKQKQTRQKAFDQYIGFVQEALAIGVRPRCHLEDVTRADMDGFVIPFVQKLMDISSQVPENLSVKIRLCDTMGFGLSYPGAAEPRSIPKLCHRMVHECGVPPERLEWHGHNDFHKVHINGTTAWLCGCNALNGTLFGFGERCGNPPLEGALFELIGLRGGLMGTDPKVLTELADYMRSLGVLIPANYPFVGRDFNVTRAGIHAGGMNRDERIYNIFDTTAVLGVAPKVAITDKTGIDGVVNWVNGTFGLSGSDKVGKLDVVKVGRWVLDQYEVHGRLTSIGDEELLAQVKLTLPKIWEKFGTRAAK
jgi:isopropylmalate/homocitrate/citramalate synthase